VSACDECRFSHTKLRSAEGGRGNGESANGARAGPVRASVGEARIAVALGGCARAASQGHADRSAVGDVDATNAHAAKLAPISARSRRANRHAIYASSPSYGVGTAGHRHQQRATGHLAAANHLARLAAAIAHHALDADQPTRRIAPSHWLAAIPPIAQALYLFVTLLQERRSPLIAQHQYTQHSQRTKPNQTKQQATKSRTANQQQQSVFGTYTNSTSALDDDVTVL